MLRWTTSHQIPVDFETSENLMSRLDQIHPTRINSTVINDDVWIVFTYYNRRESNFKNQIAVFDTTTLEARKVNCEIPGFEGYGVSSITSQSDQMYILTMNEVSDYKLHLFDTQTMIFSELLNINVRLTGRLQIVGEHMYSLARNRDGKLLLITINLTDKAVASEILVKKPENHCYKLFTSNNTLYLFKHSGGGYEVYAIDKDNKLHPLKLANADKNFPAAIKWASDSVITQTTLLSMRDCLLGTIDFDRNDWISAPIEELRVPLTVFDLMSAKRLDNKIYVVFQTLSFSLPNSTRYEVVVLELKPKLTDICLLQLVDKLLPDKNVMEVERVLEALPIPMSKKLENMIEWRSPKPVE